MDIPETLTHLRKLPKSAAEETDPLIRARIVGEILAALAEVEDALKAVRQPAVAELREQGHTVRALAAELGLSPARVDQIAKGKRA
ncbi:hypothetical protein ACOQFV_08415 [Nocardiopsis changdeensis]|uniref:Uncharacterized protein n=1 Tax=Nocardiopsis changdeensis TaxID=2831969 RepID=A0ABX8BHB9_9ACTN|nr:MULTISPECIES: hypothetical protein [Nocardiopsis]QUX20422.1 hypothetical protein KGD84_18065 [Nocardiopsis changdeensis]QYX36352.1 hypothetical protein K1J57_27520 [Nocardiopsis sp. MT53]